jgi:hypothetical protein
LHGSCRRSAFGLVFDGVERPVSGSRDLLLDGMVGSTTAVHAALREPLLAPQRSFRCAGIRAGVALFTGDHQHLSWHVMLIDQHAVYLGDTHTARGRGHVGPERLPSAEKPATAAHKAIGGGSKA